MLPNAVRVRVLNGSGVDGQAGDVAEALQKARFNVAGTGDADTFRYRQSMIRYGRGQLPKAELLRSHLGGGAQLREDLNLVGVDLVLVTGTGFSGVRAPAEGAAQPPPSTAAPVPPPAPRGAPPQPVC